MLHTHGTHEHDHVMFASNGPSMSSSDAGLKQHDYHSGGSGSGEHKKHAHHSLKVEKKHSREDNDNEGDVEGDDVYGDEDGSSSSTILRASSHHRHPMHKHPLHMGAAVNNDLAGRTLDSDAELLDSLQHSTSSKHSHHSQQQHHARNLDVIAAKVENESSNSDVFKAAFSAVASAAAAVAATASLKSSSSSESIGSSGSSPNTGKNSSLSHTHSPIMKPPTRAPPRPPPPVPTVPITSHHHPTTTSLKRNSIKASTLPTTTHTVVESSEDPVRRRSSIRDSVKLTVADRLNNFADFISDNADTYEPEPPEEPAEPPPDERRRSSRGSIANSVSGSVYSEGEYSDEEEDDYYEGDEDRNSRNAATGSLYWWDLKPAEGGTWDPAHRLWRAGIYCRDAINERPIKLYRAAKYPLTVYDFIQSTWWNKLYVAAALVHLLLLFLEPASWK
jgi:hypothetical protein